uniref:Glycosyltransferase n=1 Tax=Linum usitatissimum TaxID=4006 RepID=I2BHC4_LINUS|nr:UDP-glycosyltransferase 1 [Linum usitatissimum]
MTTNNTEAIVLYPSPAIGHLLSMVELGRLILTHRPSLSINIILASAPYQSSTTAPYISAISTVTPAITFHHLPPVSAAVNSSHHELIMIETLRLSLPHLKRTLQSIITKYDAVHAFVYDFFCSAALSVADELGVPGYQFSTSGAACLGFFLYLPTLHKTTSVSFKDLDNTDLEIPGVPKLPSRDVPKILLDRDDVVYSYFLEFGTLLPKSAGLIVNSFDSVEEKAVKAISEGFCVPDGPTPPIYCIGPLIAAGDDRKSDGGECMTWLDSQPKRSVVFLCFGSLGIFSKDQLREIAIGLERSTVRFLWVVRDPPKADGDNQNLAVLEAVEEGLETLLPEGILERTKGRGHVVKSWAPQVAVLNHESVGGFVTHCGWNSVLESVRAGVPMVAWPLYAEQRFNRVLLVEEIRIALPMMESDESGFVKADEVERRVKELMESEGRGELVRRQTIKMKNEARSAVAEGGSSRVALSQLVDSWRSK